MHILACKDPSCSESSTSAVGSLSGIHVGANFTVTASVVLLRFSSSKAKDGPTFENLRGFSAHWDTISLQAKDQGRFATNKIDEGAAPLSENFIREPMNHRRQLVSFCVTQIVCLCVCVL